MKRPARPAAGRKDDHSAYKQMLRERKRQERQARKAATREQREERRRGRRREISQSSPATLSRLARPGERRGHQASTAHVQSAYPAIAEAGLGGRGVYIGKDAYGGAFAYDPWVLYDSGALTNANAIVIGSPGYSKSSLAKTYLWRQRVFGRQAEIIDPKGEYLPLVRSMGGVILRLEPGGDVRLNPLTRLGSAQMREGLLEAVAHAMLARPLSQAEAVGLTHALSEADDQHPDREVCVPDVIAALRSPGPQLTDALNMPAAAVVDALRECALALQRLCDGPMRGMFDGPTSVGDAIWESPALALDLSVVGQGGTTSDLALGIMMVCATAFLDAKREERRLAFQARGLPAPKVIRVNDEAWRVMGIAGLGEYFQGAFKLSRQTGVQHWLVLHRLSDLDAAGDEGSRQQQLAKGLLSDASTLVIYRQQATEVPRTVELAGLSSTEGQIIGTLGKGQALWRVGGRSFLVQHVLAAAEWPIVVTDAAMTETSGPEYEPLPVPGIDQMGDELEVLDVVDVDEPPAAPEERVA